LGDLDEKKKKRERRKGGEIKYSLRKHSWGVSIRSEGNGIGKGSRGIMKQREASSFE